MPAAIPYLLLAITSGSDETGGSDPGQGICPACGSERLEYIAGYFESGVCGPNGEAETRWQEAAKCLDCGEVQEL
jgi:hypothetical protein